MVVQYFLDPQELGGEERWRGRSVDEFAVRSQGFCLRNRLLFAVLARPYFSVKRGRSGGKSAVEIEINIVRVGG